MAWPSFWQLLNPLRAFTSHLYDSKNVCSRHPSHWILKNPGCSLPGGPRTAQIPMRRMYPSHTAPPHIIDGGQRYSPFTCTSDILGQGEQLHSSIQLWGEGRTFLCPVSLGKSNGLFLHLPHRGPLDPHGTQGRRSMQQLGPGSLGCAAAAPDPVCALRP